MLHYPNLPSAEGCPAYFLAGGLERIFRDSSAYASYPSFKVFTEYLGPGSFAGMHAGDPRRLVLFDVEALGFGHLDVARVVYAGKFSGRLTEDVRRAKYGVAEGVVIKGGSGGPTCGG